MDTRRRPLAHQSPNTSTAHQQSAHLAKFIQPSSDIPRFGKALYDRYHVMSATHEVPTVSRHPSTSKSPDPVVVTGASSKYIDPLDQLLQLPPLSETSVEGWSSPDPERKSSIDWKSPVSQTTIASGAWGKACVIAPKIVSSSDNTTDPFASISSASVADQELTLKSKCRSPPSSVRVASESLARMQKADALVVQKVHDGRGAPKIPLTPGYMKSTKSSESKPTVAPHRSYSPAPTRRNSIQASVGGIARPNEGWACPICGILIFSSEASEVQCDAPLTQLFSHTVACLSRRRRLEAFLSKDTYGVLAGRSWGLLENTDKLEILIEGIHRELIKAVKTNNGKTEQTTEPPTGPLPTLVSRSLKLSAVREEYNAVANLCACEPSALECPMGERCINEHGRIVLSFPDEDVDKSFPPMHVDDAAPLLLANLQYFVSKPLSHLLNTIQTRRQSSSKPISAQTSNCSHHHKSSTHIPCELTPLVRHALSCWTINVRTRLSPTQSLTVSYRDVCEHVASSSNHASAPSLRAVALSVAFRDLVAYLKHMGYYKAISGLARDISSSTNIPLSISMLRYFEPELLISE